MLDISAARVMMKNREGTVTAIVDTALVDASAH
jgi:hypothetical protein